jgi:NADPH:quinone reductase-like Zn-dependent oxidoreductase
MRAAGITRPSAAVELLQLEPPGPLRPGEVLIDVRAAGVGNWDDIMRTGGWPSGLRTPHALGVEAAGVVTEIGADVPDSLAGAEVITHVFPLRGNGTWAEQLIAPMDMVAEKPAALPWPVAGAIAVPVLTAMQAVRPLRLTAASRILVHGAGGLTGGLIAQIALADGAEVVVTAGPTSAERLLGFGVKNVVDRRQPDWAKQVLELFGGPVGAAINATPGGATDVLPLVAAAGELVSITGPDPSSEAVTVRAVVVQADGALLAQAAALFDSGGLAVPSIQVFDIADAADALERARTGAHGAAIAITL